MRARGLEPHRTVAPVASAPWALSLAVGLIGAALLPGAVAAQSTSPATSGGSTTGLGGSTPALYGSGSTSSSAPRSTTAASTRLTRPNRTDADTGASGANGASPAIRQPLRDSMLRSAVAPGSANPLDDDRRLASPDTSSSTSSSRSAETGDEDPTADGISGLIRTDGRPAARRPRPNNQGTDTVNNQARAPAAEVDAALRPTTVRPNSSGRLEPVGSLRPREDTVAKTPQAATQPTPRDLQADQRQEAEKEDDGYAPVGLRTGGFTWLPAAEFSVGRSSNINGKSVAMPGALITAAPELTGKSDWSRHEVQIEMRGSYAAAPVNRDYDRPSGQANLRGRIDLSEEMRMDVKGGWGYERQLNSASDNPAATAIPSDLLTRTASLGVTRDVGLIALTLRGDVERADYSGGTTITGASLGSEAQNNTRLIGALRATVGSPGMLRPFIEIQGTNRHYDQEVVAGARRDSDGGAVKAGVVADLGPTLRGEMSTGWGSERPKDGGLPTMSGWLLDGTLAWSPTRLTVVKVTAKTDLLPTTMAASTGAVSHTIGATIDQSLRRDLVATVGASLTSKSYVGIDQNDKDLILSTGLTYKIDRHFQTFVRGSWERFTSNVPASDFSTAVVMVGVRVQQ